MHTIWWEAPSQLLLPCNERGECGRRGSGNWSSRLVGQVELLLDGPAGTGSSVVTPLLTEPANLHPSAAGREVLRAGRLVVPQLTADLAPDKMEP